MSSAYYLLCVSHDPAIVIDHEFGRDERISRDHADIRGHRGCDLMIGCYSYPLVEVGCLGMTLPGPTGCKGYHSSVNWVASDWLRLLISAAGELDWAVLQPFITRCWPVSRLDRLRGELGLTG